MEVLFIVHLFDMKMSFAGTADDNDQILKVDIGQDVTMSCLFDQDKIDQV